jgi:hypothetical protein
MFLLKASRKHDAAWLYCLAYAAKRSGVQLLWSTVMSNHHHTGVHDPHGKISVFCRELHRLVAKHHNCSYGRFEYFWASGPPGRLRLEDRDAVLDKLAYSITNPVVPHLVEKASQWPGINITSDQLCSTRVVRRPKLYFREDGTMPESIELTFHKPPGFEDLTDDQFRQLVAGRVADVEAKKRLERKKTGQRVLGRWTIRKQHHEDTPSNWAAHFKLNPQVATRNKWRRIEALQRLKAFIAAYRDALARWRLGERDVVFPYGTNMMRVVHGVQCCPAPG